MGYNKIDGVGGVCATGHVSYAESLLEQENQIQANQLSKGDVLFTVLKYKTYEIMSTKKTPVTLIVIYRRATYTMDQQ